MDRVTQELTWEHDAIINSSSDGLFVCDGSGRILRVNPASERINHASAAQLVGRDYLDAAQEGLVILPSAALEAIKTRRVVSLLQENRFGRKLISTATPVFDDLGTLIRVVVSERDITELDRLQRELEEQQAIGNHYRHQVEELQQGQADCQTMVARSPCMVQTIKQARKVSGVDSTILLLGESGVGKGLIADMIHKNSQRAGQPLVKINCGAIPETLIEAELFGYDKGAFTGATTNKPGQFELADKGTLFLDEIAELPLASQVKLLRFMEDGSVCRLGSRQRREVDVRILAATNRDLEAFVEQKKFRADLFYRLSVIPIKIPALRERRECLVPLIKKYIDFYAQRSKVRRRLSSEALDALTHYSYPGNVRELMNICERLIVMSDTEVIDVADLPQDVTAGADIAASYAPIPQDRPISLAQVLENVEKRVLQNARQRCRSQEEIARALGLSQPTVARKLHKYGIAAADQTKKSLS